MKKLLSIVGGILILGTFAGTVFYLWSKSQKPPVLFETASPHVADIVKKTVATGSVVPRKEVEIKPQVSGILEALYVEPGRVVHRGDPVAKIRVIPQMQQLASAENRVDLATVNVDNAEREYARLETLRTQGIVSDEEFRRAEVERARALAEAQAARDALDVVRNGTTARAADSASTLVRATISGTVLEVPVEEGRSVIEANTFNDGTTIATVADMSELVFKGRVDESEVGKLRPGMQLVLTIGAIEDTKFEAKLEHIAPKGKEENGAIQFEIRAAVTPEPNALIRANYSANADIVLDRRDQVLAVEEALLEFADGKTWVEVETSPQVFERREVATGLSDGITIEVVSGLQATDRLKSKTQTNAARRS